MSYRKKNETTNELRNFKKFRQDNSGLIEQIGLPSILIEDYNWFIYFLMHGASPRDSSTGFNIDDFDDEKRTMYLRLLKKYFESGFSNPGLIGLNQLEIDTLKI